MLLGKNLIDISHFFEIIITHNKDLRLLAVEKIIAQKSNKVKSK